MAKDNINTAETLSMIISQSLGEENREGINRILGELKEYVKRGQTYVQENPREAAGLAVAAGISAWALMATKPGRVIFEAGALVAIPYVSRWLSKHMESVSH